MSPGADTSAEAMTSSRSECVLVRDTKDRSGPVLRFTSGAWHTFAGRLKADGPDR